MLLYLRLRVLKVLLERRWKRHWRSSPGRRPSCQPHAVVLHLRQAVPRHARAASPLVLVRQWGGLAPVDPAVRV